MYIAIFFILQIPAFAGEVFFEGLKQNNVQKLQNDFPNLKSKNVKISTLDKTIQAIKKLGQFENVKVVQRQDSSFLIVATPLKTVQKISIVGNRATSRSKLLEVVNINIGEKFEKRKVLKVGEALKEFYGELSYFNTIIEVSFEKVGERNLHITFKITEGTPCRIQSIHFLTQNEKLNKKLKDYIKSKNGKQLTSDQVSNINLSLSQYLMKNKFFSANLKGPTVKYNEEKNKAELTYEVSEPFEYQIFLDGTGDNTNSFYQSQDSFKYQKRPKETRFLPSQADVRRAILYKEEERSSIDPEAEITNKIRNFYLNRGYPEIKIKVNKNEVKNEFLRRVNFKIDSGPLVTIKSWSIEGRISRSPDYYIDILQENSSPLIKRGYYNSDDLQLGQKNLITDLQNQGFLMAKIQSTRIEYLGRLRSQAKITIHLDEGPLTQVRRLEFIGNKEFSDQALESIFLVKSNSPLRLQNLEKSIDVLKKFYLDRGYLEMKILNDQKNIVRYNKKGTQANIVLKIFEGPKIRVKSILVEGNSKTKTPVIIQGLSFKEGDVLTPELIEDSSLFLNRMGLFARVSINTVEQNTDKSQRTILVSVDERDPGLWRLGAGVNSERELTARAFTGVSYNNLWGTARGISTRLDLSSNVADLNYLEHKITAGYLEPFMFGTKMKGRVNLSRSDEVFKTQNINDEQLVEILTRNQLNFLLDTNITRNLRMNWTVWGIDSRTNRWLKNRCPETDITDCSESTIRVAKIGPVFDLDFRDNPFLPTKGNYSRLGVDYSAPFLGSSRGIEFVKVDGTFRHYTQLYGPRLVWANEFRSGYLSNLSPDADGGVPTSYAFFLGSFSTVRGYDFTNDANRIPKGSTSETCVDPEGDDCLSITNANKKLIKSDSHFYMVKTELRFPIYGSLGGVIFYDGGAVLVTGKKFNDPYRESVGFGLRINTPVGPISADLGFKLDRQKDESWTDFHFSIGTF